MSDQEINARLGYVAYVVTIARGNITNSKIETVDEIHNRLMAYDDIKRERDELRQWKKEMLFVESQWDEQMVGRLLGLQLGDYIKANIEPKLRQLIRERDEARAKLSRNQQTLTIAEGTISDLRKQRDEWSAMCSRYKQERDIAEQDATNYHARIIELIAERDKTKQERDEARDQADYWKSQYELEKGLYVI